MDLHMNFAVFPNLDEKLSNDRSKEIIASVRQKEICGERKARRLEDQFPTGKQFADYVSSKPFKDTSASRTSRYANLKREDPDDDISFIVGGTSNIETTGRAPISLSTWAQRQTNTLTHSAFTADPSAPEIGSRRTGATYSRPSGIRDPDYFDWDYRAAVEQASRDLGQTRYKPSLGPQKWELQALAGASSVPGSKTASISTRMFTKTSEENYDKDYRSQNAGLLSAALRTPSFWEKRFDKVALGAGFQAHRCVPSPTPAIKSFAKDDEDDDDDFKLNDSDK